MVSYNKKEQNGEKNLLHYLYFCENTERIYKEKGISEEVLLDTLSNIVTWTKIHSKLNGRLYLGELEWLKLHLNAELFKLGRLQFRMAKSYLEIPEKGLRKGDNVVEVHIPDGEPLDTDACVESFKMARDFLDRYFPEFEYSLFICYSWLLDKSLSEFLSPTSNILKFANLFEITRQDPCDSLLGYLFKWGATRDDIKDIEPTSSLAAKVKTASANGRIFYEGLGYVLK